METLSEPIDIDYVANLARIRLTATEKQTFASQLTQMLDHFKKLETIDVTDIEPMSHAMPLYNVWAEDRVEPGFTSAQALQSAPTQCHHQVVVPRVIDGTANAS